MDHYLRRVGVSPPSTHRPDSTTPIFRTVPVRGYWSFVRCVRFVGVFWYIFVGGGSDSECVLGRFFRIGFRNVAFKLGQFFFLLYTRPVSDLAKRDLLDIFFQYLWNLLF